MYMSQCTIWNVSVMYVTYWTKKTQNPPIVLGFFEVHKQLFIAAEDDIM